MITAQMTPILATGSGLVVLSVRETWYRPMSWSWGRSSYCSYSWAGSRFASVTYTWDWSGKAW